MLSLQFGARRDVPRLDGKSREVGSHALHVFCAWRLRRDGEILVASGDLYTPVDPHADLETFDWDEVKATWWDAGWYRFSESSETEPIVQNTHLDEVGGLSISLSGDARFEVFPNSSAAPHVETEFWRLLRPGTGDPHFVVATFGFVEEHDA
jgi:hypothetical protein